MTKNLKKVISAVAALAISASAVSAFAVNFPDVPEDASYAQAVQELSALDVISGYDDGTFKPDELVTRAQITKMIVDALNQREMAEASKANSQFNDVATDHWAKGYINQGVADGFIAGYSSTEFGPDDNVTYVQAQKMLVSAIGYETYAQGSGGWPNGYKTWAASQGITAGISGIADDTQLTRAQVAQLVDNAMGAPICVIKDYETTIDGRRVPNLEIKDDEGKDYQTLFTKQHNAYKVYGRVKDTNKTNNGVATDQVVFTVEKADNFDDEYIKTNSGNEQDIDAYYGDTNAVDMLRTYAQALIQKNDDDEWVILSITAAAANKSVTLAAEDIDTAKSDNTKLYFYPAGTTKNSTKYTLADTITVYVNGQVADSVYFTAADGTKYEKADLSTNRQALIDYIDANDTAAVVLQKETKTGSTSTESDYNIVMITNYTTAIVSEVQTKSDQLSILFDEYAEGIANKLVVYTEDDNYTYSFLLGDEEIDPADLQEGDVLSIAYDETGKFADSSYYDVVVSRDTAEGKCTTINSDGDEFTIGGTKYKAAAGMSPAIVTSGEYTLYLDHFGRIAKADEDSVSKKYGILKNIYKKAGGDWYAQVITKEGVEEEYKIDNATTAAKYAKDYLGLDPLTNDGVAYGANEKLAKYPTQVVEYSVASSSNKITIKSKYTGTATATKEDKTTIDDAEYKASASKIGSVKLGDSTVILDISEADDDDDVKVVSVDNLTDGNNYKAYGYDRTDSGDRYYRFVLLLDGTSSFNSEVQLAVYNGSELVDVDDDTKTAFNVVINGEEHQYVVKDDTVADEDTFVEGDAFLFTTNGAGEIAKVEPIFAEGVKLDGNNYDTFKADALKDVDKVIRANASNGETWNKLLDGTSDKMGIVFGVVVNKSGNTISLAGSKDITTNPSNDEIKEIDGTWVNYDTAKDYDCAGATVYTYDFNGNPKNSKVFTDDGLVATTDIKSIRAGVKASIGGADYLNLDATEVKDDVVFAVARVDDDEVKEIYLIVNED